MNRSAIESKGTPQINRYLDSTFGYYTLDLEHKFVLAHYNWHEFADVSKSKGITDPSINLQNVNELLEKRLTRMFDLCDHADHVFFIFGEFQKYKYMQVGDEFADLHDFSELEAALTERFGDKFNVLNLDEVSGPSDLLQMRRSYQTGGSALA